VKQLAIPPTAHPLVSVVMVTYGGRQWVEPAVGALVAHTEAPFELIVVDNASTDGVQDVLRSIEGARLFFNDRNVGFGPGANQGVLQAIGRYVCILNSDAFVEPWVHVLPGWQHFRFVQGQGLGSNSDFGFMAGGGLDFKVLPRVYWRMQGDYIGTHFQSDLQSNFSVGTGLVIYF